MTRDWSCRARVRTGLVHQLDDRVLSIVIQQLDELQEDRASLAFGQDIGNHNYTLGVLDGNAPAEGMVKCAIADAQLLALSYLCRTVP